MKFNKASDEDGIPVELLKHTTDEVRDDLSNTYKNIFEKYLKEINEGRTNLKFIPKTNMEQGLMKHLRPMNLLNSARKVFSLIIYSRIPRSTSK